MQSLNGTCLIAYAKHEYILTMVNGESYSFNSGDLVFADASQILFDQCIENAVFVTKDTLSLFLPMLKEEALNIHAYKKVPSLIVHHCTRDIPVFQEVVQLSQSKNLRYGEVLRKRALIFAILSVFLEDEQFITLLMNILQPNMRMRVCTVINRNIAHEWSLAKIASELLMSPSLLKKKLREEETSYSQLLTECRMRRALQLIVRHGFSIKRVAALCGYNSVSYFIYVFRNYYGMTPTEYHERIAERGCNNHLMMDVCVPEKCCHPERIVRL
ncbi:MULTISPECIES: DNA-binding transcriptional regulator GadX [unclassified Escherichia]|uniref:DNA-binding transcriptional regulator GadX n=1 Tax=unclassified Escherichia TaxID=2608889 RepID=UPI0010289C97|nr:MULTISPECIES: DNA-binding transcriptional regulator GadX [unclassified Escherichia]RZM91310.1 AraC family transcriptional regulator [Escherichia sp. E1V33]TBR68286.1 AraC family transcriptional regulator [Escherichia sp. E1S7]